MGIIRKALSATLEVSFALAAVAACVVIFPASSRAETHSPWDPIGYSLTGDVYDPKRWHELGIDTLFTEGWDEPWAGGPNGEGGAPRQGWIDTEDGVFYRLFLFTFDWTHAHGNDSYAGGLTVYTPISRRFQIRWDIPFVTSSPEFGGGHYTDFGDLQITPRVMLSETQNFSQSLDVTFRTPTGSDKNGNDLPAISPIYNFWWNAVGGLVLRGGVGGFCPLENGVSDAFTANLAAGYYFTPHDMVPFGDLVWYLSANLDQLTDGAPSDTTTVSLTPGFRTHLGANFYLLGGVEVPVTNPEPFDYQVSGALMKVW